MAVFFGTVCLHFAVEKVEKLFMLIIKIIGYKQLCFLVLFFVCADGDGVGDEHDGSEHGEVEPEVGKTATFEADAAHDVDKIAWRQDVGERLSPWYH